jgi:capsid protein
MFEHALLVQVCSCLDIPFGIAIGDFSGSSYAGGRLDTQGFFKTIQVERKQCTETVIEPVFNEWLAEASRVPGLLPPSLSRIAFAIDRRIATDVPHVWRWDSMPHIDIKKEIDSYAVAVNNNFCTRAYVAAEVFGLDGHDVIIERGQEASLEKENGVAVIVPGASVVNPEDGDADQITSPDEVSEGVTTQ